MALSNGYCRASGCASPSLRSTHSPYCSAHRHALNRWGHALQSSVSLTELEPFRAQVRAAIQRNPNSEAWSILTQRWQRLVIHAESIEASRQAGVAHSRYEAQAGSILRTVASSAEPLQVLEMAFAVFMLQAHRPARFRDDHSFRFVLARRVRGLAPMSSASYYDPKKRRNRAVYRDVASRVTEFLGMWLAAAFGAGALQFITSEQTRAAQPSESQRLAEALEALR